MFFIDKKFSQNSAVEYIDSQSSGDAYVFLHGISSGADSWVKQFSMLGEQYRLLAWNAPGYGNSAVLEHALPNALDYAERLNAFLVDLGIDKITLVGHSLGAMMASAFAAQYSEKVKELVLVNAAQGYGFEAEEKKQDISQMRPKMLKELGAEKMAKERGPFLLHMANEENMAIVKQVTQGLTQAGFEQASHLLAYDSIENYLPNVSCPIRLIYGLDDVITPPAGMLSLKQKYNKIYLQSLEQAGHLAYIDQPEAFNRVLFNLPV